MSDFLSTTLEFAMKIKSLLKISSAVLSLAVVTSVSARAADVAPPSPQTVGELSAWGQWVIPSNGRDDGNSCSNGGSEFCGDVWGVGGYAGFAFPMGADWALLIDGTLDYHEETNDVAADRDHNPLYGGLGAHLLSQNSSTPWGVFGVATSAFQNNADEDGSGLILGGGAEMRFTQFYLQGGALFFADDDDDSDIDTLDNLFFARVGGEHEIGPGMLEGSLAVGFGDFDEDSDDKENGEWVQLAVQYEAPLLESVNWFAGYQGDWVRVDEEQAFFHAVKLGITIPIGGGNLPFSTPNFRAPVVNAGEMN
jgi:hypothetical protein